LFEVPAPAAIGPTTYLSSGAAAAMTIMPSCLHGATGIPALAMNRDFRPSQGRRACLIFFAVAVVLVAVFTVFSHAKL
jgi:hypothetical protein